MSRQLKLPTNPIRGLFIMQLAALLLFGFFNNTLAQPKAEREARIKAAFLYHLIKFVDWPSGIFKDPNSPFKFCFIGSDILVNFLQSTLKNASVGTRSVVPVFDLSAAKSSELVSCHLLYIGELSKQDLDEIESKLLNQPVLIVSSNFDLTSSSGVIHLFEDSNRLKVRINRNNAEKRALRLSSDLLDIAELVN